MKNISNGKRNALLISPLLLFFILVVPYSILNSEVIVDWLGCGCPRMDEFGNYYEAAFNANDFTACFWLFITLSVTVISAFLSIMIPREKMWLRVLYVFCMFAVSLFIAHSFIQGMMWK